MLLCSFAVVADCPASITTASVGTTIGCFVRNKVKEMVNDINEHVLPWCPLLNDNEDCPVLCTRGSDPVLMNDLMPVDEYMACTLQFMLKTRDVPKRPTLAAYSGSCLRREVEDAAARFVVRTQRPKSPGQADEEYSAPGPGEFSKKNDARAAWETVVASGHLCALQHPT